MVDCNDTLDFCARIYDRLTLTTEAQDVLQDPEHVAELYPEDLEHYEVLEQEVEPLREMMKICNRYERARVAPERWTSEDAAEFEDQPDFAPYYGSDY
tara:strand:+ start:284 stop:577 length:294 start_codon:yes stop_codon:yes gene_type:complete